jgi:hypothetical protein
MYQSPSKKAGRGGTRNKRGSHDGAPSPGPLGSSPSASSIGFVSPQVFKRGNRQNTPRIIKDILPVRMFSQNTHDSSGLFANTSSYFGEASSRATLPASNNPLQDHAISCNPPSNLQISSAGNQATFDGSFANNFRGPAQSFYNGNGPSPPTTSTNHNDATISNPMDVDTINLLQYHPISCNPPSNLPPSSARNQATFDDSFVNNFRGPAQSFYNKNGPSPPTTSANHYNAFFSNPMDVDTRSYPPLLSPATSTSPEIEVIVKCPNCGSQLYHGKKLTSLVNAPANLRCDRCKKLYFTSTTTMGNSPLLASAGSSVSHGGNGCSSPPFHSLAGVLGYSPEGFHQSPNLNLLGPLTLTPTSSDATDGQQDANRKRREQVRDVKVGQCVVKDVPKSFDVYKWHVHERLKKSNDEQLRIRRILKEQSRHVSSLESRFYLGKVASAYPDISAPKFQAIYAHSVSHFLNYTLDFKIDNEGSRVPFDDILRVAPKKTSISSAVSWAATLTCIIIGDLLEAKAKGVSIYCGSDKVDDTLVITISFNNPETGEIEQLHIASEPSEGSGEGSADAIMHALKRIQIQEEGETEGTGLRGQVGDSGGGGTTENLAGNIKNLELHCPHLAYFIANCCEHNGANTFAYPFKQCLGEGSLDKINPLQTCHSCWYLQECFDADTFRAMWIASKKEIEEAKEEAAQRQRELDNGQSSQSNVEENPQQVEDRKKFMELFEKISQPVLTRWKLVGEACDHTIENWDIWEALAWNVYKMGGKGSKLSGKEKPFKAALSILKGMRQPFVRVYLNFILVFHRRVHKSYMDWTEATDPRVGKTGYRARQAFLGYYLYTKSSKRLAKEFSDPSSESFVDFRESLALLEDDKQRALASTTIKDKFFPIHDAKGREMFGRWGNTVLIFLACFEETPVASIVAQLLLDLDTSDQYQRRGIATICEQYAEPVKIDLDDFREFAIDHLDFKLEALQEELTTELTVKYADVLLKIANGYNIWSDVHHPDCVVAFLDDFKNHFRSLPSTSQFVERYVKLQNRISSTGRKARMRNAMSIAGNLEVGVPSIDRIPPWKESEALPGSSSETLQTAAQAVSVLMSELDLANEKTHEDSESDSDSGDDGDGDDNATFGPQQSGNRNNLHFSDDDDDLSNEEEDDDFDDNIADRVTTTPKRKKKKQIGVTKKTRHTHNLIMSQWDAVKAARERVGTAIFEAAVKRSRESITSKSKDYQTRRQNEFLKNFAQAQSFEAKDLPDSVLNSEFHHTPKALGYVIWDDLLSSKHLKDLRQEVRHRIDALPSGTIEENLAKTKIEKEFLNHIELKSHWMKLKNMLKGLEKEACRQEERRYEASGFKQMAPSNDLFTSPDVDE